MRKKVLLFILLLGCLLLTACDADDPDQVEDDDPVVTDPTDTSYYISEDEYEWYFEKYLSAWSLYNPFRRDYTESTFVEDFHPYFIYASSMHQETRWDEFVTMYGDTGEIPADYVELLVTRHFPLSVEQYRASLPQTADAYEYYDSINNLYDFPGGYGGVEMRGELYEAFSNGNILLLSCDWYGLENTIIFSHRVTIILGDDPLDFYYKENVVTYVNPNE